MKSRAGRPERCPECGSRNLAPEGRCLVCLDCGWSACIT
jgi:ribonucleoside-diphosphate reductase alpha chain